MSRKRKLPLVLASLASLVLADVLVSAFLIHDGVFLGQPLPPFEAITHPRQSAWLDGLGAEEESGIGTFDAELGWTWRPSSRIEGEDGVFTINALGARGPREYEREPPAGVTRLLFFGDSFTFCDEMGDWAAFQHIFEKQHPRFEAINFGVSGYGTDQAFLRYRALGRDLGADVVFIGILLENVGRNVNRYRPLWSTATGFCATKPRFVLGGAGLELLAQPYATRNELRDALLGADLFDDIGEHEYWLARPRVPTGRWSSLARIAGGFMATRERSPQRLWQEVDGEPFRVTLAILEAFHREALADGARLAPILIFPAREDIRDHAVPGRPYWNDFLAELERRELPYLNLIPALLERYLEEETRPEDGTVFYKGHLSSVGNAVVAEELHEWLSGKLE